MIDIQPISVLIADDHAVVRKGLEALINAQPDMQLIGSAENGGTAVELALETRPDVILLDIQMPLKSGVEATEMIRQKNPAAKILILTSFGDDATVYSAIKAGAQGFFLKDGPPQELLQGIRDVHRGVTAIHPTIAQKVIQEIRRQGHKTKLITDPLTEREIDVLLLVAKGLTNQEIADQLVISERTARTHISNILSKLHLANRTQAALYALKEGLAKLENL